MTPGHVADGVELYLGDCLEVLAALPSNSVDAVITVPPYFRFKGEQWDRQWDDPRQFLAWLDLVAEQWHRVLKPNGSLYCFASPRMAARVEVKLAERFNILNHIVWEKPRDVGKHAASCKEALRSYFPNTERIIFAEHYGADNIAKGEAGYVAKCDELRGFIFEPLRAYLDSERERAGFSAEDCNEACGHRRLGGMAGRHYFSRSQWGLPTRENYERLRAAFNATGGDYLRREYEDLRREYEDLRREYEDLRREYEDLRRPFSVTADSEYTDVWQFLPVQHYKQKHPCEKPLDLMRHMVRASCRPGAVVLDSFMGTGSTGVAALMEGCRFIGIEMNAQYFDLAKARIESRGGTPQLRLAI